MTDNISDDQLSQFLAFTGSSDPNIARQYLEMSGNQLEMAVSLFMDHNNGNNGGAASAGGGSNSAAAGLGGMGSPEVRAPDATRSMRLVGGPPSPGGNDYRNAAAQAALMAAVGGPNAAQQMMAMAGASAASAGGGISMDDVMANTWASRDLRETVNRAASARGNRRNRSSSSSNNNNNGGGGGNNNSSANNDGNRRRRTGSRSRNNHHNDNDSDDDEVQVVDEHGNVVGETMEESDEDSYHYNDDSDDDDSMGGGNNASIQPNNNNRQNNQPPNLSTMFLPPTQLIHNAGGFLGAKNFAKDARRWLLVNIQSEDDFACHALNRDVWHDELVENLVREGFVFWQVHSTHPEGMTYCQRYKVEGRYPHIAIIDPRTGSLLYRKEGWTQVNPLTAEQFVEIASDFCSRHSFDKAPMPARHGYANGGGSGGMGGGESRPAKRPVHELSEQEQLEAAIRASMQDASGEQQSDDDDDDDEVQVLEENDGGDNVIGKSIEEDTTSTTKSATQDNNLDDSNNNNDDDKQEEESKVSPFLSEIVSMTVPTEPTTTGPTIARVQLRMPNGKRLVRKFDGDSPVKVIYAYVAQLESNIEDAKAGKLFELKAKFPPVDLMPFVEDSISSVGLSGEAITFLWK